MVALGLSVQICVSGLLSQQNPTSSGLIQSSSLPALRSAWRWEVAILQWSLSDPGSSVPTPSLSTSPRMKRKGLERNMWAGFTDSPRNGRLTSCIYFFTTSLRYILFIIKFAHFIGCVMECFLVILEHFHSPVINPALDFLYSFNVSTSLLLFRC